MKKNIGLIIVGWILIILVFCNAFKDFHFTPHRINVDIFAIIATSFAELFNPISIIGICLLIIGNRNVASKKK